MLHGKISGKGRFLNSGGADCTTSLSLPQFVFRDSGEIKENFSFSSRFQAREKSPGEFPPDFDVALIEATHRHFLKVRDVNLRLFFFKLTFGDPKVICRVLDPLVFFHVVFSDPVFQGEADDVSAPVF